MTRVVVILCMILAGSPYLLWAQPLECGVIREGTRLEHSCHGPMIIEADGVTVDLGGHTIDATEGGVEIINRTGVTLRNGGIGGLADLIVIHGGGNHTLHELNLNVEDGALLSVEDSDRNVFSGITTYADIDGQGVSITGRNNVVRDSLFSGESDSTGSLFFLGSGNTALRNTFTQIQDTSMIIVGSNSRFTENTLHFEPLEVGIAAIDVIGSSAIIEGNSIQVSGPLSPTEVSLIAIRTVGSKNTIVNNVVEFQSTEAPSYGVYVSLKSTRNLLSKNRITGSTNAGEGVAIWGSHNQIFKNTTDSVYINGPSNQIIRNISQRMTDAAPNCGTNIWRRNIFTNDSEGDGPGAGCIR